MTNYTCVTCINNNCNMNQSELMNYLQSLAFAINDLILYLDTHPNDKKALELHNNYANKYRYAYEEYERRFGPLSIYCPCESYRWIDLPWPWEGDMN